MAILGRDVVMGFGDVGISAKLNGTVFDPCVKIRFYQLESPHLDPSPENEDTSVIPVSIVADLRSLELLHSLTGKLLNAIYDRQLAELNGDKERLQVQVS